MKPPRSAMPVRPDTDNLSQQNMNFFSFFIVILQFLRPKTFKKLLQSSLHTHTHTHTHTNFIPRTIAVFLKNRIAVFLFHKNHNRNPPERTKNLAEHTEKPINTYCKSCKNRLWHKKRSKIITMKEILQNWGALQFSVFSSNKMINKYIAMLN